MVRNQYKDKQHAQIHCQWLHLKTLPYTSVAEQELLCPSNFKNIWAPNCCWLSYLEHFTMSFEPQSDNRRCEYCFSLKVIVCTKMDSILAARVISTGLLSPKFCSMFSTEERGIGPKRVEFYVASTMEEQVDLLRNEPM